MIDYLKFEPHQDSLDEEDYGHILEIYEFPADFKNEHIYSDIKEIIGKLFKNKEIYFGSLFLMYIYFRPR